MLEIACFNTASVQLAQDAGADRVELCVDYTAGGLTPPEAMIREARAVLRIPLHAIIRPTARDFVYTAEEFEQMKREIALCKHFGVQGVVLGILTAENTVDEVRTQELVDLAHPMSVTFHRAVDACVDLDQALQQLIRMGINRVLTSGGKRTALEGKEVLRQLNNRYGNQILILPGGGIRSTNIVELKNTTHCLEYHSAAITGNLPEADPNEIKALKHALH